MDLAHKHASVGLTDVLLDDTTNSIWVWSDKGGPVAYDEKTEGGACWGKELGRFKDVGTGRCIDVDKEYEGSRIRCVEFYNPYSFPPSE